MTSPKNTKTIRLQNLTVGNLSLSLAFLRQPTVGSMRRGPTVTPLLIGMGKYYDVCAELGVDFEEAKRILARSPEVQRFKSKGTLAVIVFPPEAPPAPPPPSEDSRREAQTLREDAEAAAPPAVDEMGEKFDAPVAEAAEATEAPVAAETPAEEPRMVREPSMDWTEEELREYATKRGIDISNARTKTSVLRQIRTGA